MVELSYKHFCHLTKILPQVPYSQHIIFFMTYKWPKKALVLHYARLERYSIDKQSNLLGQFVGYEENELL